LARHARRAGQLPAAAAAAIQDLAHHAREGAIVPAPPAQAAPRVQVLHGQFLPSASAGLDDVHVEQPGEEPLSPSVVAAFMTSRDKGIFANLDVQPNRRSVESDWSRRSEHVQAADDTFPQAVQYPPLCGALCASTTSQRLLAMHANLLLAMATFTKDISLNRKPAKAVLADALVAVELLGEGTNPACAVTFWALIASAGKYFRHPDSQMYLELRAVGGQVAVQRFTLRAEAKPYSLTVLQSYTVLSSLLPY
jgi:hypothetical protein